MYESPPGFALPLRLGRSAGPAARGGHDKTFLVICAPAANGWGPKGGPGEAQGGQGLPTQRFRSLGGRARNWERQARPNIGPKAPLLQVSAPLGGAWCALARGAPLSGTCGPLLNVPQGRLGNTMFGHAAACGHASLHRVDVHALQSYVSEWCGRRRDAAHRAEAIAHCST